MPAGTRNHFALDLGIDRADVPGALDAFDDGVDTRVDLAEINGRVFVNNASMGVYAKVVQSADYRDAKVSDRLRPCCPTCWGRGPTPLDLHYTLPSGQEAVPGQLLLVSNNPYDLAHLRGGGTRERLDGGVLGVVSLRVGWAADAEKLAALEMPRARSGASPAGRSGRPPSSWSDRPGRWRSASTGRPWSSSRRCASPSARAP